MVLYNILFIIALLLSSNNNIIINALPSSDHCINSYCETISDCGSGCNSCAPDGVCSGEPMIKESNNDKIVTEMLDKISNWILTLDLSSNNITGIQDTLKTSIFINGNLARVLISNYKISGKDIYLNEALKWCDTFVSLQHDITTSINTIGGYWDTGYSEVYIADTGTAIAALSMCYDNIKPSNTERRALYQDALLKYDQWVRFGSKETPKCYFKKNCEYDGNKGEVANTFINQSTGALSDGYYKNAINLMPYTIATATYGGVGYAEMYALGIAKNLNAKFKDISTKAVKWILSKRESNGEIPYIITPPSPPGSHIYQSITYSTEAFVDASLRFNDTMYDDLKSSLRKTVKYLLDKQGESGILIVNGTQGEQQRSPRALSLWQWYLQNVKDEDPKFLDRIQSGTNKYIQFIYNNFDKYGLNQYALVSGFVGLVLADMIDPWVTFVGEK
jgi:hypothetical protein